MILVFCVNGDDDVCESFFVRELDSRASASNAFALIYFVLLLNVFIVGLFKIFKSCFVIVLMDMILLYNVYVFFKSASRSTFRVNVS